MVIISSIKPTKTNEFIQPAHALVTQAYSISDNIRFCVRAPVFANLCGAASPLRALLGEFHPFLRGISYSEDPNADGPKVGSRAGT